MKKRVQSSHLALRFYKHDGWTKEILDQYLTRGRVCDQWEDQEPRSYWFLDHTLSSQLDMERLYREQVGEVLSWQGQPLTGESAIEYMRRMNW